MRLKSFFANTIEEAIRSAREELGPEAMLMNSKRAAMEAQHLGLYEVVVSAEEIPPPVTRRGREITETQICTSHTDDRLAQDISELKHRMERLALTLARSAPGKAGIAFNAELSGVFTYLSDMEFDTNLAYDLVSSLPSPVTRDNLKCALLKLVRIDSQLGTPGAFPRVVAFVGPPGAGKTSALVKLAAQHCVGSQNNIQVVTIDTYRIAAPDELRSYAAILGIGCQVLETAGAIPKAIHEHRNKDLILIDTPGLSRSEMDVAEDLRPILAAQPIIDTHLVLPASMRGSDLARIAEQYMVFQPRKMILTRLDETETLGHILSCGVRLGLSVSFLSRGQRIPEDLERATEDSLLDFALASFREMRVPGGEIQQNKFGVAAA
jgi:flagellar biosynthesis protein FlhF